MYVMGNWICCYYAGLGLEASAYFDSIRITFRITSYNVCYTKLLRIKWLKLRDKENALSYWKEYLEGYSANVYPVGIPEMDTISEYNREEFSFCFDELLTNRIISFCNINRITIGIV